MKRQSAFTILELLISLSISAFVILGMLQGYQNVNNFINRTRGVMIVNRKICLLFNQLERDLISCFIPTLNEPININKPDKNVSAQAKDKDKKLDKDNDRKLVGKGSDKKDDLNYFCGEIFQDKDEKINGKRRELFRLVNFVTTNAMRVYMQKRVMLVRVKYELIKDRYKSRNGKDVYRLLRLETTDLGNFKFVEDESVLQKNKKNDIKKVVIADNIKNLFIEYIADEINEEQKKNIFPRDQLNKVRHFTWGDRQDTVNTVPEMVNIYITFWDDDLMREYPFEFSIPILSYRIENNAKTKEESSSRGKNLQPKTRKMLYE